MKVFKFGGASVKDAEAVRNISNILNQYKEEKLVVVVSAMGKTTNALERVVSEWFSGTAGLEAAISDVELYHRDIIAELFSDPNHPVHGKTEKWFRHLREYTAILPGHDYDFHYDQVVCAGEYISTLIVSEFLHTEGIDCKWLDVRDMIKTDHSWREGKVDWEITTRTIQKKVLPLMNGSATGSPIVLTQGFIGGTSEGEITTLGREGSDYTAAIFSFALDADEMIIWKDVPGLLNADPKYFNNTHLLSGISYREAIELSYYGATIIHPKTIKPLQNKNIPLRIKSFVDPGSEGSIIHENNTEDSLIPSFIFKVNQALISISPRDFSFIDELNLSEILAVFASNSIHINLMQNSAISFSVCVDNNERRLKNLFEDLEKDFNVKYNTGLELITIRHYDQETIDRVIGKGKTILLEMRSRVTAQYVVKPE